MALFRPVLGYSTEALTYTANGNFGTLLTE